MQERAPHAAQLLARGEALAVSGDLTRAEALLRQGRAEYGEGSLLSRRHCQVLTALGRRPEAIRACSLAVQSSQSNANFRAMVRALVTGPVAPTVIELSDALAFTAKERDRAAKGNPTPAAAMCDIAESLGDGVMLQRCAEELERFAPDEPDTRRAVDILASQCPPWRFWSGWLAIVAAAAGTVGHAFLRTRRRRGGAMAFGTALVAASAFVSVAHADPSNSAEASFLSRWPVDDEAPETKIPSDKDRDADPLEFGYWLQDVALKAERASKRGDHEGSARFYRALAAAVPDRAVGFTRMCSEYEAMGDRERAATACGAALLRDGLVVNDYVHYVDLVLAKPEPLTPLETKALEQVVKHMREDQAARGAADGVDCAVATRTSNVTALEVCTKNLALAAPNDPRTVSYQWSLAMLRGRYDEANVLIERGSALGLREEGVASMQRATLAGAQQQRRRFLAGALALVLLIAGLVVGGRALLRRRTLASHPA